MGISQSCLTSLNPRGGHVPRLELSCCKLLPSLALHQPALCPIQTSGMSKAGCTLQGQLSAALVTVNHTSSPHPCQFPSFHCSFLCFPWHITVTCPLLSSLVCTFSLRHSITLWLQPSPTEKTSDPRFYPLTNPGCNF